MQDTVQQKLMLIYAGYCPTKMMLYVGHRPTKINDTLCRTLSHKMMLYVGHRPTKIMVHVLYAGHHLTK